MKAGKLLNKGFTVLIMNGKGGVGKSNTAFHLAHNFNFEGMDFDVKGNLSVRLPEKFSHIPVDISLNDIEIPSDMNVIIDMGGNDDYREVSLAESANLIIVPYTPSIESVMTTATTLERIKHVNTPILFIATMVEKNQEAETEFMEQVNHLADVIGSKEIDHMVISRRKEYTRVTEDDTPIMQLLGAELDKHGNPSPMHFRKRRAMAAKKELNALYEKIMTYK